MSNKRTFDLLPVPTPEEEKARQEEAARKRRESDEAARREFERTGGPIHPTSALGFTLTTGLTIRDYFAAHLVAAIVSNPQFKTGSDGLALARHAYEVADALLLARRPEVKS